MMDMDRLEEERRLAYVGITRAKQKLTLCYAESRRLYAKEERHFPSRFLNELPKECVREVRIRGTVTRAYNQAMVGQLKQEALLSDSGWRVGQKSNTKNLVKGRLSVSKVLKIIPVCKLLFRDKGLNGSLLIWLS